MDTGCLHVATWPIPSPQIPSYLVAVYWTDLNPSQSGDIRTWYDHTEERYVIEWRDVPFWKPGAQAVTFGAVLYADGRLIFQYGSATALGNQHHREQRCVQLGR